MICPLTSDVDVMTDSQLIECVYLLRDKYMDLVGDDDSNQALDIVNTFRYIERKHNLERTDSVAMQAAKVMQSLLAGRYQSAESLSSAGAHDPDNPPFSEASRVVIHRLRKLLKHEEILIENLWGSGYKISRQGIDRFKALMLAASQEAAREGTNHG